MIPFRYPPGTKTHLNNTFKRQDYLISKYSEAVEQAMRGAVDYIFDHWERTGRYHAPSLQVLDGIMENFYHGVITEAFQSAKGYTLNLRRFADSRRSDGYKRLAGGKWPLGIPKNLTGLEKIFRDKRYWPKIMKRSQIITDRVRKQYLRKLQQKFNKILPNLHAGTISPIEGREALMKTWDASKSRVELIFRTETTTYFGKTQTAFFADDPEIIGYLFDSIRDRARTDWCRTRHGIVYRPGTPELTKNTPALHWNCRSHLIPLANTAYNRKLLADPQRDPSNRKVAPLPDGWKK